MMTALDLFQALGLRSLEPFWLPLVAWTLVALPAYALLTQWRAAHPLVRYRARQALLFALPLGMLAAAAAAFFPAAPPAEAAASLIVLPSVAVTPTAEAVPSWSFGVYHALGLLTVLALVLAAGRLARLALHAAALARFRRALPAASGAAVQHETDRLAAELGLRRPVRTVLTPRPVVPLTFGLRRPTIVLPEPLAHNDERLRMTLTHELIHIRRGDYLMQWLEQITAALFAVHPLAARLHRSIADYRERACDAAVLDDAALCPKHYAALLYSFAAPPAAQRPLAVTIAETGTNLQERISAMKDYLNLSSKSLRRPKLALLGLAALLVVGAVGIAACSDLVTTDDRPARQAPLESGEVFIAVEDPPELKGGLQALAQEIKYPEAARAAGIEGSVFVQFIVGEEGHVREATVLESPHDALSAEALRVVEQAQFEPGHQDGEAVRVRMTLPITFQLPGDPAKTRPGSTSQLDAQVDFDSPRVGGKLAFQDLRFDGNTVMGRIVDAETGRPLAGANVVVPDTHTGAATHSDGSFTIQADTPVTSIQASFVGYAFLKAKKQ